MREAGSQNPSSASSALDRPVWLSLCMIVRDNERTVRAALESIRPYVDELVVVDTGSVDATPNIAKSLGAKVFHFAWCDDFAKARNESLARATGDWVFWMDSDDTISADCGEKLRALANEPLEHSPMAYVMQVHCPGAEAAESPDITVVDHVKMFRNRPEIRFEGRIHEQVLASVRKLNGQIEFTDIHVVHSGSDHSPAGRKRKQERDLRLIELELTEQPDHPFHLFNLGMTLADMGRHAEAVQALRKTLEVAQPHESHVRKAYALLVSSLTQLHQHAAALEAVDMGLRFFSQDAELHFRRGIALHNVGRKEEAIAAYRAALQKDDARHFASIDPGIAGFKARHNLAVIYTELGELDQAELQWRLTLEEVPTYRAGWRGLVESLLAQRKLVTCEVELLRMERLLASTTAASALEMDLQLHRVELAKARGKLELCHELLQSMQEQYPEQPAVLRAASQFYFERQEFTLAEHSLSALTELVPEDGAAWHNLGTVYMLQKRFDEAASALRTSLLKRPGAEPTERQLAEACRQRAEQKPLIQA